MLKHLALLAYVLLAFHFDDPFGYREDPMQPTESPEQSVDLVQYQWNNRLLLLFAPTASDPAYQRQQDMLTSERNALDERDLLVGALLLRENGQFGAHEIAPAASAKLAKQLGIDQSAFTAVLIGKDGGVKLTSSEPITTDELFQIIDAMPMRRQEMRNE